MNNFLATPLGEHSGCSYPACTSQEEILKASAPGLIPQYEKDEQVQLLKDVEFTLKEFPALVETKVIKLSHQQESIHNFIRDCRNFQTTV